MKFLGKDPNILDAFYKATADGSIAAGKPVIVTAAGKVKAVAESAASAGTPAVFENAEVADNFVVYDSNAQKVVIAYRDRGNSDYGTAIVGTVDPSDNSISFGSAAVFESADSYLMSAAYDANAQKVVIVYRDGGNSQYGTAVVGTVSSTSISFGTPVVFESAYTDVPSVAYDSNAQKVVIAFRDVGNSNYGTAIVGTVSSTSISFGSAAVFESANTDNVEAVYDASAQKVVIFYSDGGNSNYGTAIVGTVSSTSISFGSAAVFESATSQYMSAVYDSNAQKTVVAYRDGGNSNYGTAVVGTISGTDITFGSATVFESADIPFVSAVYDSKNQKVFIAYEDSGNSSYGTFVSGTVSGTSISFDSPAVFDSTDSDNIGAAYDANAERVVIAYRDGGNSQHGTAVVVRPASTNLTSENYIGIAADTYADNEDSTIGIVGCIDRNQTSLTAGQQYFVQTDGTLSTTAGSPSVLAGTAISATELVVKE